MDARETARLFSSHRMLDSWRMSRILTLVRRWAVIWASLLLVWVALSCMLFSQEQRADVDVVRGTTGVNESTTLQSPRLSAGDLIEINVYNVPELATKSRVNNNGDVYLPLINYVHLSGLTAEEGEALIQKRLSDGGFVNDPHVSLLVDEHASGGVSILGEVARPGVYPLEGDKRLFDLISAAGGLTEKAGRIVTLTHRVEPDKPVTVPLSRNLDDRPESNVTILPGDTIIVRKADIVYVVGDVGHPSGFLTESGRLTVLQAIALAGGTSRTANLGGARIIRKGSSGMTETPVQLKKILEAKAPDLPMQGDDILFIPTSARKAVLGRTLEVAVQAATTVSIVALMP